MFSPVETSVRDNGDGRPEPRLRRQHIRLSPNVNHASLRTSRIGLWKVRGTPMNSCFMNGRPIAVGEKSGGYVRIAQAASTKVQSGCLERGES
ncbi:3530_t:CDS:1, partial [Acaulospora colombiana]